MTNLETTSKFIKSLNLQEDSFYAITIYKDYAILQGHITSNLLSTFNRISKEGQLINGNVEFTIQIDTILEYKETDKSYKFNIVLT